MSFADTFSQTGEKDGAEMAKAASIESPFFIFEAVVRNDRTLVIHLKNLRRDFQNPKMLDYLAKFVSDRIGRHEGFHADFLGTLSEADGKTIQKFDSLDIFVKGYAPLMVRDHRYVVRHICDIGTKLIETLNANL